MILITGGGGLLGSALSLEVAGRGLAHLVLDRQGLDVADASAVTAVLDDAATGNSRITTLFHCAAYTAVDQAESDAEAAHRVNVLGTRNVVRAADEVGARVVLVSTDYVFDDSGSVPITPSVVRRPRSVYGRTKAEAEDIVLGSDGHHLVARTSWLFGMGGRNFVDTMIALRDRAEIRVVDDQVGRPTYAPDLAEALIRLEESGAAGAYHLANSGQTTWHGLAQAVFDRLGGGPTVIPVSTESYGAPAPRPVNSVLDCSAAETLLGGPLRHWTDALDAHLHARGLL